MDVRALKGTLHLRVVRDTGWTIVVKVGQMAFGFLVTVLLARVLGAESFGIYTFAFSTVMLIALPVHAGLPTLVLRETARGVAADRPGAVLGLWRWAGRFTMVVSLVLASGVGPLLVLWQGGFSSEPGQAFLWAVLLVPLVTLGHLRNAALQGLKRIVAGQVSDSVVSPLVLLTLVGVVALVSPNSLTASTAMAFRFVAATVAFLVGAWLLFTSTPPSIRAAVPERHQRGFLGSVGIFSLLAGFQLLLAQADIVVLGLFKSPGQVGIYKVGLQVATLAVFGLQVVITVLAPRVADLYAKGDREDLQRLVTAGTRVALASALILSLAFLVLGRWFLPRAFGDEYAASYVPMAILLLGQVVNCGVGPVALILNMTGQERRTATVVGGAALLNIALNFALVPSLGVLGAAAATSLTMMVWNLLLWRRVRDAVGVSASPFGSS